jgi:hypothetical protein
VEPVGNYILELIYPAGGRTAFLAKAYEPLKAEESMNNLLKTQN